MPDLSPTAGSSLKDAVKKSKSKANLENQMKALDHHITRIRRAQEEKV